MEFFSASFFDQLFSFYVTFSFKFALGASLSWNFALSLIIWYSTLHRIYRA